MFIASLNLNDIVFPTNPENLVLNLYIVQEMKLLLICLFTMTSLTVQAQRALWVWSNESFESGSVIFDSKEEAHLSSILETSKIDSIYLDMQQIINDESHVKAFSAFASRMKRLNVETELLLGKPQWATKTGYNNFNFVMSKAINFLNKIPKEIRPKSIHLDIEPQALPQWNDENLRGPLLESYLSAIKMASDLTHTSGYKISIDAGFYFDQFEVNEKNLALELMSLVDQYVILSYRDFFIGPNGILETIEDEIEMSEKNGLSVKIFAAVETNKNEKYPQITFYDEGIDQLNQVLEELEIFKHDNQRLKGVAIHDYLGLKFAEEL